MFIATIKLTVLLIHENMVEGKKVEEVIIYCMKDWSMESIDAKKYSGGILTAWSFELKLILETRYDPVLWTQLEDRENGLRYTILNVYGPFYD